MSCYGRPLDPDANPAPRAALEREAERAQLARFTQLYSALREATTPTIPDAQLDALGVARGPALDLDNLGAPGARDEAGGRFFSPCGWPLDVLSWESHSGYADSEWKNLMRFNASFAEPFDMARFRASWFQTRLLALESIEENVWEPVVRQADMSRWDKTWEEIKELIGLELPRYEEYVDGLRFPENEFKGTWAYFAQSAADQPHAVVTMLDSSRPSSDDDDAFFRSEVRAAVKMTEFQLQQTPRLTHHRTKPVLVCTYFRNETARIIQVHFNTAQNRLVLRPSRLLNLSGAETPPDAWLMLRWMASSPVGPTLYEPAPLAAPPPPVVSKDGASRPPMIIVGGRKSRRGFSF